VWSCEVSDESSASTAAGWRIPPDIADDRRLIARPSWLVAVERQPAGQEEWPGFWGAGLGCDFGSVMATGRGGYSGASAQRAGHLVVDVDQFALGIRFESRDGLGGRVDHNCEMVVDGVGHRTPRQGLGRLTGLVDSTSSSTKSCHAQRAQAPLSPRPPTSPRGLPPASDRGRPQGPPVGNSASTCAMCPPRVLPGAGPKSDRYRAEQQRRSNSREIGMPHRAEVALTRSCLSRPRDA